MAHEFPHDGVPLAGNKAIEGAAIWFLIGGTLGLPDLPTDLVGGTGAPRLAP
jgi:hypothetical protein